MSSQCKTQADCFRELATAEKMLNTALDIIKVYQEEYVALQPAPKPSIPEGYTPWSGGECPVNPDTVVDVVFRNNDIHHGNSAKTWKWENIIAYKVIQPADQASGLREKMRADDWKVEIWLRRRTATERRNRK